MHVSVQYQQRNQVHVNVWEAVINILTAESVARKQKTDRENTIRSQFCLLRWFYSTAFDYKWNVLFTVHWLQNKTVRYCYWRRASISKKVETITVVYIWIEPYANNHRCASDNIMPESSYNAIVTDIYLKSNLLFFSSASYNQIVQYLHAIESVQFLHCSVHPLESNRKKNV